MRVSIRTKILLPVTLIMVVAFLAAAKIANQILEQQRYEASTRTAIRVLGAIEGGITDTFLRGDPAELRKALSSTRSTGELTPERVALRYVQGNYFYDSIEGETLFRDELVRPAPGKTIVKQLMIEGRLYMQATKALENKPECRTCHGKAGDTVGYLQVDLSAYWLQKRMHETKQHIMAMALAALSAIWLVVTVTLNYSVFRPVQALTAAMEKVRKGQRDVTVQSAIGDEIGLLSSGFNEMVHHVAAAEMALVQQEQRLAQAEKLAGIGLMAAGVAHEINNPLTAVSVAAEGLQIPGLSQDKYQRFSQTIVEGADRIKGIVSDLLTMDQKQSLKRVKTSVKALIDNAIGEVAIPDKIELCVKVTATEIMLAVDEYKIRKALGNLIKNAVQAMLPAGGRLTIEAENRSGALSDELHITVSDTGGGIDPQHAARVFDPFFSTREVGQGYGLGLAFAKMSVVQHGGDLTILKTGPQGATFAMVLPVSNRGE